MLIITPKLYVNSILVCLCVYVCVFVCVCMRVYVCACVYASVHPCTTVSVNVTEFAKRGLARLCVCACMFNIYNTFTLCAAVIHHYSQSHCSNYSPHLYKTSQINQRSQ